MIMSRSDAVTVAVAAAAAFTATGITYVAAAPARQAPTAPAAQQAPVPAQAPFGGGTGYGNSGRGNDEHGDEDPHKDFDEGWIQINERSYFAHPGGCVVVISGLGATSLNILNDSRRTVEVFRGVTCDNGAPIATVGPRSSSNGVTPGPTDAVTVKNGVVGSFRVVDDHLRDRGDF
jgi:hypothetical protein